MLPDSASTASSNVIIKFSVADAVVESSAGDKVEILGLVISSRAPPYSKAPMSVSPIRVAPL